MKIYLAGKIGTGESRNHLRNDDWRFNLIDSHFQFHNNEFRGAKLEYVGPWMKSPDFDTCQGLLSNGHASKKDKFQNTPFIESAEKVRDDIVMECTEGLLKADAVFAFINDPTCFGTLFELGLSLYAQKFIYIAFSSKELKESMWFIDRFNYAKKDHRDHGDYVTYHFNDFLAAAFEHIPNKFEQNNYNSDLLKLSYKDYLKTDHWTSLRNSTLSRFGHRCSVCNSEYRLEVHHRTYERKGNELPEDLIALCSECHAKFHNKIRGIQKAKEREIDNSYFYKIKQSRQLR